MVVEEAGQSLVVESGTDFRIVDTAGSIRYGYFDHVTGKRQRVVRMEGTVDVDVSGSKLDSLLSLNQALYFHLDTDEFLRSCMSSSH